MKELIITGTLIFISMIGYIIYLHKELRISLKNFDDLVDIYEKSRENSKRIEQIYQQKVKRLENQNSNYLS